MYIGRGGSISVGRAGQVGGARAQLVSVIKAERESGAVGYRLEVTTGHCCLRRCWTSTARTKRAPQTQGRISPRPTSAPLPSIYGYSAPRTNGGTFKVLRDCIHESQLCFLCCERLDSVNRSRSGGGGGVFPPTGPS